MSIDLLSFLRNPDAKYFVVPLVTALLSIMAKMMSSNDRITKSNFVDYFYLAPNLLVSNFIFICCEFAKYETIIDVEQRAKLSDACVNALIFNIWLTIAITLFIRKFGWDSKKKCLHSWWGIWIPDLAALVVMIFVFSTLSI